MLDNRELREKVEDHAVAMARFAQADTEYADDPNQLTHDRRTKALDELTAATRAIINHVEEWPTDAR